MYIGFLEDRLREREREREREMCVHVCVWRVIVS